MLGWESDPGTGYEYTVDNSGRVYATLGHARAARTQSRPWHWQPGVGAVVDKEAPKRKIYKRVVMRLEWEEVDE